MSMIRYNPRSLTPWFDFDRFFEDFDKSTGGQLARAGQGFQPAVDIYEDEKAITISADLPDLDQKDIDVHVQDGHLTIKGERKFENEETKDNYRRVERRYGSFTRTFSLPDTVDDENIDAKYEKGVLRLTLPKLEKPKSARTITINQQ